MYIMEAIEQRLCTKCDTSRPITEFHRDRSNVKTGLVRYCRTCLSIYQKAYRERLRAGIRTRVPRGKYQLHGILEFRVKSLLALPYTMTRREVREHLCCSFENFKYYLEGKYMATWLLPYEWSADPSMRVDGALRGSFMNICPLYTMFELERLPQHTIERIVIEKYKKESEYIPATEREKYLVRQLENVNIQLKPYKDAYKRNRFSKKAVVTMKS